MSGFYLSNSFFGLLATILPTAEETQLLRACLWSGESGAQAWQKWRCEIPTPAAFLRQEKGGVKGLLALLFDSLQTNGVIVEGEFRTYLRTAYLRDELRSQTYSWICRNVIDALASAGIPAALLKGAALAETCYKRPSLQHAHYLDILIKSNDLDRAAKVLRPQGFTRASFRWEHEGVELLHPSGLPLVLHRRMFRLPIYSISMEEIWARSRTEKINGIPTRILCSLDNLLHICGSVFDAERYNSLRWVCDAWFLIQRYPNLDWNLLLECARRSRTALPLFVTMGYLAGSLEAPIPTGFLRALHTATSNANPLEREAALYAIQTNARGGLKRIVQNCDNWPTRVFVLKWAFLPSSDYMRSIHDVRWSFLLPVCYVYRPLRYLVRSSWFFAKRVIRRLRENLRALRAAPKMVFP
jgi:putative nucleotidyltransferase-like protein